MSLCLIDLAAFTAFTITAGEAFKSEIHQIQSKGFAVDGEEKNLGMRCIAAPVFDVNNEVVAGISVSGPTSRVGLEDIDRLSGVVMAAAQALSIAIGGKSSEVLP